MANEILKDNLLTDEQLNDVAGGTAEESLADYRLMCDLNQKGVIKFDGKTDTTKELERAWAQCGITVIYHDDKLNEYYDGKGNQITHAAALDHASRQTTGS